MIGVLFAGMVSTGVVSSPITLASVAKGIGVSAIVSGSVAKNVNKINQKKIYHVAEKSKSKIIKTKNEAAQIKNNIKSETLSNLKSKINSSSLNESSKKKIINQINLPTTV